MPESLVVGGQLGNYLIESVIGRGGMSVVYRAQHVRLGTPVALKVLAPELSSDDTFRERFLREAKMAAGIDHPNVVPIYDTGLQDDCLYIVMRNVAGGDLKAQLRESGHLEPRQAVEILLSVAKALDAAHSHGLVHRDVKPANILLQRSAGRTIDHVYLSDFGVMKHTTSVSGLTGTGAMIGTIDYMAPEQIENREISSSTDVYALACVLYQCITGRVPFARDSDAAVLWAHVRDVADPPSSVRTGLTTALDAPIARALAKEPGERYATCVELMLACDAALEPAEPRRAPTIEVTGPPYEATIAARSTPSPSLGAVPPAEVHPAPVGAAVAAPAQAAPVQPPPAAPPEPRASSWFARHWWKAALLLVAAGGAIAGAVAVLSGSSSSPSSSGTNAKRAGGVPAALGPVPTNRVPGRGRARVQLQADGAVVSLSASGLLNGASHAMHFHAGGRGICPPASAARLHHGNRAISTTNGGPFYGGPVTALTTSGDTSPGSILAFNRFPVTGVITYERRIPLPAEVIRLIRQGNAVVVIHGIDYNHNGIYDGVLDRSELDRKYFGESTAPALCGPLVPGSGGARASAGTHGSKDVYVASLAVRPDDSSALNCPLRAATSGGRHGLGLTA